jgi:hypothetical protein
LQKRIAKRSVPSGTTAFDGHCSSLGHGRKPLREAGPSLSPVASVRNDRNPAMGKAASAEVIDH